MKKYKVCPGEQLIEKITSELFTISQTKSAFERRKKPSINAFKVSSLKEILDELEITVQKHCEAMT